MILLFIMKKKQKDLSNEVGEDYTITLTDAKWIRLIDGECDDSDLGKCCANCSELRDTIISIVRDGRNQPIMNYKLKKLMKHIKWVADGHDLSPTLKKICEQIDFDPNEAEHEKGSKHDM